MSNPRSLLSFEFICLNLVSFFAFSNMAVFYSFFSYMDKIGIPAEWRGFLLGLEPMAAFVLRLAVIPLLHAGNATSVMLVALSMLVAALFSYGWAVTIPGLILLRIFHGAAFVLLVSASMALVVHFIPKEKSGQGFGFVSISVLIPYAVMPLLTEALLPHVENEAEIYRWVTVLALPAFLLLGLLRKRMAKVLGRVDGALARRLTLSEIRENLRESHVILILAVNFFLYVSYATVFYFMKGNSLHNGITDVGSFFTLYTLVMIAVRVFGTFMFDKTSKFKLLALFTLLLIPCFLWFGQMRAQPVFYLLACGYGLCLGFIMPLLNGALFDVSPPHLRGLNTNLALFMMDAGFFLSPYGGGLLLASGYSFGNLFDVCAAFMGFNLMGLMVLLRRNAVAATAGPSAEVHG
jgi:MFS family permease